MLDVVCYIAVVCTVNVLLSAEEFSTAGFFDFGFGCIVCWKSAVPHGHGENILLITFVIL